MRVRVTADPVWVLGQELDARARVRVRALEHVRALVRARARVRVQALVHPRARVRAVVVRSVPVAALWVLVVAMVVAPLSVMVPFQPLGAGGGAGGWRVRMAAASGGDRTAEAGGGERVAAVGGGDGAVGGGDGAVGGGERAVGGRGLAAGAGVFPEDFLWLNLASLRLQVWREGLLRGCYPVAIGKPSEPTPTGIYRIVAKRMHPTWYPPEGGPPVPPGPDNPLGSRFLALSLAGYGLHGTNAPASIGRAVSRGCVRLSERDVALLWRWAYPSLPVRIVYQRVVVHPANWGDALMVWPDPYQRVEVMPREVAGLCTWPVEGLPLAQDAVRFASQGPVLLVVAAPARPEARLRLLGEGPWLGGKGVGHEVSN